MFSTFMPLLFSLVEKVNKLGTEFAIVYKCEKNCMIVYLLFFCDMGSPLYINCVCANVAKCHVITGTAVLNI